ncbi:MAG: hypothetical protein MUF16_16815 [Burkholderiaceae bacterium]|jgi:hypothetical protein|nr:hypothetical protein [Burkholderiaceae bacterium]
MAVAPTLYVVPPGTIPPHPAELLERLALRLSMCELAAAFNKVVVDTTAPPSMTAMPRPSRRAAVRCSCRRPGTSAARRRCRIWQFRLQHGR